MQPQFGPWSGGLVESSPRLHGCGRRARSTARLAPCGPCARRVVIGRLKAIGPLVFAPTELASVERMIRRADATMLPHGKQRAQTLAMSQRSAMRRGSVARWGEIGSALPISAASEVSCHLLPPTRLFPRLFLRKDECLHSAFFIWLP